MKKKKKKNIRRLYEVSVIPCVIANIYAVCISAKDKASEIIAVVSTHNLSSVAHDAAAVVRRTIKLWAIEGVEVAGGRMVYVGAPCTPVSNWIVNMRETIKAVCGSELAPFESIAPIKAEAQSYLRRKIKLQKLKPDVG